MAAASSSSSLFGVREEDLHHPTSVAPPLKKKRNLPGTPNPDAEVIALSPKTLMATNRFICEVCNKGFQREQNLQLHRRGHNLPWKLRQKSSKEVKKRVYLCPEPSCVHHDPSRALGDLTGIKKHYLRKHGEKKWKCEKCSKRYAVQSDWKAHSKTCGTREYRCDCGTLFSRRDSFITHRAFCDALAQESARIPPGLNSIGNQIFSIPQINTQISSLHEQSHLPNSDLLRLGHENSQFSHLLSPHPPQFRPPQANSSSFFHGGSNPQFHDSSQNKPFHSLIQLPDLHGEANSNLFNLGFFPNSGTGGANSNGNLLFSEIGDSSNIFPGNLLPNQIDFPSVQQEQSLPHLSATALLQKAAQIGATASGNASPLLRSFASSSSSKPTFNGGEEEAHIQNIMNSLASGGRPQGGFLGFGHDFGAMRESKMHDNLSSIGGSDGMMTRDFLGVGSVVRSIGGGISSQREQRGGLDLASLESDFKSASAGRSSSSYPRNL